MKKLLSIIVMLCVCIGMFAQATDLVIDNQTPGWLSSKINYGDQLTVKNLKVTGYINDTDMKFIGTLINRSLDGEIDLSECNIVGSTTDKDNILGGFGLTEKKSIRVYRISKSVTQANSCLYNLHCDTLYFDCKMTSIDQSMLWNKKLDIGHLYLGDNIESIPDNALGRVSSGATVSIGSVHYPEGLKKIGANAFYAVPIKECTFPQKLTYIGDEAFFGHSLKEILLPDSMEYLGKESFKSEELPVKIKMPKKLQGWGTNIFGNYSPDTVRVPYGIVRYDIEAIKYKNGQTWFFPETINYIKGDLIGGNSVSSEKTKIYLDAKNVVEVNVVSVYSDVSIDAALEGAKKFRKGWTVYVPKGMIDEYKNSKYWYDTSVETYYGKPRYWAHCYWCHATFIENIIKVLGIKLDNDNLKFTKIGDKTTLHAIIEPENADNKSVKWTTTNPNVCVVSSDGQVIASGYGDALVIATTEDGGFMDYCTVNVQQPSDIDEIEKEDTNTFDIYTIDGILLRSDVSTYNDLPQGIYIINGKKVVVK